MRILFIDIDTLRPDHLFLYGYRRNTTPNLDALARDAVVFDNCFTSDSPCVPSRAAFTSQQFGAATGAIGNAGLAAQLPFSSGNGRPPKEVYLGGHLYRHGIRTTSFSCFPERHQAYWFVGNFREWAMPSLSLGDDQMASEVVDAASSWLEAHAAEENWFLHLHFWDPHTPYVVDPSWSEKAASTGPAPDWPSEELIAEHYAVGYGPHSAFDLYEDGGRWQVPLPGSPTPETMPAAIRNRQDFEMLINGYDGGIAYCDSEIGRLFDLLASLGHLEDTAVIVASDHGECLGENGIYGDHPLANEAVHHVPLIVRWPGLTTAASHSARHVEGLVYTLDLGPTLCELLGLPVPEVWSGTSFASALRGEDFAGRGYLVLSHGAYSSQRAVRTREHLYVATFDPGLYRVDPEQLYELSSPGGHLVDRFASASPGVLESLRATLFRWTWGVTAGLGSAGDPIMRRVYESPEDAFPVQPYVARLRATGRERLAAELLERRAHWPDAERLVTS
jgi:arylsulfatase A-like enzyme